MSVLLEKIQKKEIEAFVILDRFCKANGIKYFLRGGSVLGAVKYNGFVPWDDDIDIAVPRNDYEKLISLIPERLNDELLFVSYKKTKNSHCYFPRVLLNKEHCKSLNFPINNEKGLVLLDILPIDGMPNNIISLEFHIFKAYIYRILASLWTLDVSETVSMHDRRKQKVLKVLHALKIHYLYQQDDIYKKLDQLYTRYMFMATNNSGMLASSKLKKEVVPSSWWGEGAHMLFCGIDVLVPQEYDLYLKRLFGEDYACWEPLERDRKKSHLLGVYE